MITENANTRRMAPSVDEVREAIEADGYCDLENDTIGKPFDELVGSGFHIQTKPGMELCRRAIFRNEVVRRTATRFFGRSEVGFYRKFGITTNFHCVLPKTSDMRILIAFIASSGSRIALHRRSHLYDFGAVKAGNGFLKLPDGSPNPPVITGLEPAILAMDYGGLAIVDARTWWKIEAGTFALLGIMTLDESQYWAGMPLPIALSAIVSEMTDEEVGMKVLYFNPDIAPLRIEKPQHEIMGSTQ